MNIQMALKLISYILDLDHVKLSLGIFLFSELFNVEFITPAFRIYFLFSFKKHTLKVCFTYFYLWEGVPSKVVKCNVPNNKPATDLHYSSKTKQRVSLVYVIRNKYKKKKNNNNKFIYFQPIFLK